MSDSMETGLLLRLAHQRASRAFNEALRPLGVESRHFGVLTTLARLGPLTQTQLVVELDNDKSAMVRTVDDLERLGLCRRRPLPGDRRARRVELTPAGRELLASARHVADHVQAEVFGRLTERERTTLRGLLRRLIAED